MIDTHCHILPNVDDGASSMQKSIDMARVLHEQGYEGVIATPHVMPDTEYDNTHESIKAAVRELSRALQEEEIPLKVYPGAEYYFDRSVANLARLYHPLATLADSYYVLVELPMMAWPPYFEYSIWPEPDDPEEFRTLLPYLRPIIAHPERNQKVFNDYRILHQLRDEGYFFQVNLENMLGLAGRRMLKVVKNMAKDGLIDLLGTDGHRPEGLQKLFPKWRRKVEKMLGKSRMELILEENPRRVINNETIELED